MRARSQWIKKCTVNERNSHIQKETNIFVQNENNCFLLLTFFFWLFLLLLLLLQWLLLAMMLLCFRFVCDLNICKILSYFSFSHSLSLRIYCRWCMCKFLKFFFYLEVHPFLVAYQIISPQGHKTRRATSKNKVETDNRETFYFTRYFSWIRYCWMIFLFTFKTHCFGLERIIYITSLADVSKFPTTIHAFNCSTWQ